MALSPSPDPPAERPWESDPDAALLRGRGERALMCAVLEDAIRCLMLLDQCWDAGYEGVSNLVDVHVGRVRRKLEGAGGPPLLHTIRGAGFVLDERPR